MQCQSPRLIKNSYLEHPIYGEAALRKVGRYFEVPCQKCAICRENKRREWVFRNYIQSCLSDSSFFCTMTYDEDHCDRNLHIDHYQKFFKLLRKHVPWQFQYFLCGEYGGKTYRPHYHMLLYINGAVIDQYTILDILEKYWNYGEEIHIGNVSPASISYVMSYIMKNAYLEHPEKFTDHETGEMLQPPFIRCSKKPAIGEAALTDPTFRPLLNQWLEQSSCNFDGVVSRFPRYYQNKMIKYDFQRFERFCKLMSPEAVQERKRMQVMASDFDNEVELQIYEQYQALCKETKILKDQLTLF